MKQLLLVLCMVFSSLVYSQEASNTNSSDEVDYNYKEDQFYFSVTYNLLNNIPDEVSQNGFSSGFHLGFIKDMPINKARNKSIGVGLGLSTNSINQNILIDKDSGAYSYSIVDSEDFTKNKFSYQAVELPIEFRWRTSTPEVYKFWRVYLGFKTSYVLASKSKFKGSEGDISHKGLDVNKLQYGVTASLGYSTWNLHVYYGLNPIFKDSAKLNDKQIDLKQIRIGMIFYLL